MKQCKRSVAPEAAAKKSAPRIRKARLLLPLILLVCVCAAACVPPGYINKEEHYDPHGFQDYTDYCKYRYASADAFRYSAAYRLVTAYDVDEIKGYFDDFRQWMETGKRIGEYDFDPACIGAGDYVRIETKEGQRIGRSGFYRKYDSYSLYYFDIDSLTLYYIHNNI